MSIFSVVPVIKRVKKSSFSFQKRSSFFRVGMASRGGVSHSSPDVRAAYPVSEEEEEGKKEGREGKLVP